MNSFLNSVKANIFFIVVSVSIFITGCSSERGGVIVDSSGEQGGGTQPGGGGFAFVLLFVVVFCCVMAMFAMDRIQKKKLNSEENSEDKS